MYKAIIRLNHELQRKGLTIGELSKKTKIKKGKLERIAGNDTSALDFDSMVVISSALGEPVSKWIEFYEEEAMI